MLRLDRDLRERRHGGQRHLFGITSQELTDWPQAKDNDRPESLATALGRIGQVIGPFRIRGERAQIGHLGPVGSKQPQRPPIGNMIADRLVAFTEPLITGRAFAGVVKALVVIDPAVKVTVPLAASGVGKQQHIRCRTRRLDPTKRRAAIALLKLPPCEGLADRDVPAAVGRLSADFEPQRPQFGSNGCLPAAEVGGLQRAQLGELIVVGGAGDRLGVVAATLMKQVVLACPPEPIPLQLDRSRSAIRRNVSSLLKRRILDATFRSGHRSDEPFICSKSNAICS